VTCGRVCGGRGPGGRRGRPPRGANGVGTTSCPLVGGRATRREHLTNTIREPRGDTRSGSGPWNPCGTRALRPGAGRWCGVRSRTGPEPDAGPGRPGGGLALMCCRSAPTDRWVVDRQPTPNTGYLTDDCVRPHARPGPASSHARPGDPENSPGNHGAAVGSAAATAAGDQDGDSRFGLSVTQIVASTAAAVFGHSLLATRRHMTRALRLVRPAGATPPRRRWHRPRPRPPRRAPLAGGHPARRCPDRTTTRRSSFPRSASRPSGRRAGPGAH